MIFPKQVTWASPHNESIHLTRWECGVPHCNKRHTERVARGCVFASQCNTPEKVKERNGQLWDRVAVLGEMADSVSIDYGLTRERVYQIVYAMAVHKGMNKHCGKGRMDKVRSFALGESVG